MDWITSDHKPAPRPDRPAPTLIELCWRMKNIHTGKVMTCGIYRIAAPGIEVRVGFSEDDALRTQLTANIDLAREHANDWKRLVVEKGGFEDLPFA